MKSLFKSNFIKFIDLNYLEINFLINFSLELKEKKLINKEIKYLKGKNIALIFEKSSTRTLCSFQVAAFDQGASYIYINNINSQIGSKESIKDTSRVLSRIYNGIQYRGYDHKKIEILAKYSNVPVWNGLTNISHPTQVLADLLTIREHIPNKPINKIKLVYIGDCLNNISNSLIELSAITGINLTLISPKKLFPKIYNINNYINLSKKKGGNIIITDDINIGVKNADFIYTDVWISMGDENKSLKNKINMLKKYRVDMKVLSKTDNSNIKFLHCLPSFHNNETIFSNKFCKKYNLPEDGIEVTDEVFESSYSIVFDQSENRLHTIKSLIISTMVPIEINYSNIL